MKRESFASVMSAKDGVFVVTHRLELDAIINEKFRLINYYYKVVNNDIHNPLWSTHLQGQQIMLSAKT